MLSGQAAAQTQAPPVKAAASASGSAAIEETVGMQVLREPLNQILTSIGSFSLATPTLSLTTVAAASPADVGDTNEPRLAKDDSDREATILAASNQDDPALTPASYGLRPLFRFRFFLLNFN